MAAITILYNLLEGLVSIRFGLEDEALSLFGFGIDSFIEVLSGIGIFAMVVRIRRHPGTQRSQFEKSALRLTGISFYLLGAGLLASAVYNLATAHRPVTTLPGTIIALVSIAVMGWLVAEKRKAGNGLSCSPILADANCTMVCIYMSLVLLAASLIYELTGIGYVDSVGALGLMWLSVREGRESLEKAGRLADDAENDD
jgi:divalent metal cation (Fe/Co/Zn/Cd) transporter